MIKMEVASEEIDVELEAKQKKYLPRQRHNQESLNDETKDSACFTRKICVKSAKAPARIEKEKLWLLDQLFKKHVYGVYVFGHIYC